jgi:archaeal cell division control protein 6
MFSIIKLSGKRNESIYTGEVYNLYKTLCDKIGFRPLTQRRISDIIAEFDMLGLINVKVISKGRYGRTREIFMSMPENTLEKIKTLLIKDLNIE